MGLDTGVYVKKTGIETIDKQLKRIAYYVYDDSVEIAYWRKCWNVREAIGRALGTFYDNGQTNLDLCDINAIIKEMSKCNKHNWLHNGWDGSIWEWKEIKKHHRANIRRLRGLAKLKKKYPIIDVIYYDSY